MPKKQAEANVPKTCGGQCPQTNALASAHFFGIGLRGFLSFCPYCMFSHMFYHFPSYKSINIQRMLNHRFHMICNSIISYDVHIELHIVVRHSCPFRPAVPPISPAHSAHLCLSPVRPFHPPVPAGPWALGLIGPLSPLCPCLLCPRAHWAFGAESPCGVFTLWGLGPN